MGNTVDNGMKIFLGGAHALAGVFDHEFETRVFVSGKSAGKQLQSFVSAFWRQPKDRLQVAAAIPGREPGVARPIATSAILAQSHRGGDRRQSVGSS